MPVAGRTRQATSDVTARNRRENASTRSTRGSSNCSPVARSRERNLSASGEARKSSSFTRELVGGMIMTRKRYFAMEFLCEPQQRSVRLALFAGFTLVTEATFGPTKGPLWLRGAIPLCDLTYCSYGLSPRLSLPRKKFRCKMALQNRRVGLSEMRQDARENAAS